PAPGADGAAPAQDPLRQDPPRHSPQAGGRGGVRGAVHHRRSRRARRDTGGFRPAGYWPGGLTRRRGGFARIRAFLTARPAMTDPIRLTQYSHGAGCGCKISPQVLDTILAGSGAQHLDPRLWVGNASKDDAAVYAIDDERGVVSTTDFFMPIVDDPFDFGRIAATNAISDIYAMGGDPLMAIAILGWPVNVLAPEVAREVIRGGRAVCDEAGIPLAGGHSIDAPEPIFGLAVTGLVSKADMKRNDTATAGCKLYLSKPLGIGILTTAEKTAKLRDADIGLARDWMCTLNKPGSRFGKLAGVRAMTDVTGFGLLGHLVEMADGSGLSARIEFARVPRLDSVEYYLE